jgi:peptidyl-prolyl cis-trans isomerase C
MRRLTTLSALSLAAALLGPAALAQTAAAPAPAAAAAPADPVVATINGIQVHLSDIQSDAQNAPQQIQALQQTDPGKLYAILVNQEVNDAAFLIAAKKAGLENNPQVAKLMEEAADTQLEKAYVEAKIASAATDAAVQAYYNANVAGKPGPQQIDARHILVSTQAQAEDIINQLNHGANFAALATKYSQDPGAKDGGELGWFTKDQMVAPFANAAFALKPGQYTQTPVQTQFGWHVILCEGKRNEPTPALADVSDQIRQTLEQKAFDNLAQQARSKVKIAVFNPDGSPVTPSN